MVGGTGGNDTLTGGVNGTNYLYGDAGSIFFGATTGGDDRLVSAANTERAGAGPHARTGGKQIVGDFSSLTIVKVDTDNDNVVDSSVIKFDANNSVTVYGITDLGPADFHFVV